MKLAKKYYSKGINKHTTYIYTGHGRHAGIDKNHDTFIDSETTSHGAFYCFEIADLEQYGQGEGRDTIWYRTHEEAIKIVEDYLKGKIHNIPRKEV